MNTSRFAVLAPSDALGGCAAAPRSCIEGVSLMQADFLCDPQEELKNAGAIAR